MTRTLIAELPDKVGQQVRIRGWVHAIRDQKSDAVRDRARRNGPRAGGAAQGGAAERAERGGLGADGGVGGDDHGHRGGGRARQARRPRAEDSRSSRSTRWRSPSCRSRPTRRSTSASTGATWTCAARTAADLRGADHSRARDARVLAQGALHRAALAEAHGLGQRVRRRAVQGRLLRKRGLPGAVAAVLQADGDGRRLRQGVRGRPRVPRQPLVHLAPRHRVHERRRGDLVDRLARGRDGLRGALAGARARRPSRRRTASRSRATFGVEVVRAEPSLPESHARTGQGAAARARATRRRARATTSTRRASARCRRSSRSATATSSRS